MTQGKGFAGKMMHPENMVEVKCAFKCFNSSNVILHGLNMTVEQGTIYGLLGPSGCGKTTLLSCVAGHIMLDAGSVKVRLDNKRQMGYMPQDIALIELFTVSEILQYFGKLNGLPSSKVMERGQELLRLMELPSEIYWKRMIANLSGGEQRRISLIVALLHDPVLLILDEPTVGLDPLINDSLWAFFLEITENNGKTIIITTHYIEEARQAHMIGLMRNGVLLAEAAPLKLLQDYNCSALEDVFLFLSQNQNIICKDNQEAYPKKIKSKLPIKNDSLWDRDRMAAQIYKNICWVKRNIPIMLFMLVLPAILTYLFCIVYSDSLNGVTIAMVSEEILPDSCQNTTPIITQCNSGSRLSCQYVKLISEKSYIIKEYQDFDSGFQSVVHGNTHALLHFERNYSWALIRRLSDGIILADRYVNKSMVAAHIDMAEISIGYKIKKDIRDSFDELIDYVFKECDYNLRLAEPVLKFEKPIYGEKSPKFKDTAIAGFIISFTFYFTTTFSAASLCSEKLTGFLERCLISGVRRTELLFAHLITQVLMVTGQNFMVFTIAYGIYDMPLKGSWSLIIVFVTLSEIQGMFYGFFLATLCDEEKIVSYASVGTVICIFLSCGMFWPIEGAHWTIYTLLRYSPIVMAVESYRSVTVRGWDITHKSIITSIAANIGLVIVFLVMFLLVSKIRK